MVKPGDPILKHLTASWFNKTNSPTRNQGGGGQIGETSQVVVTVRNHDAIGKEIYEPVALGLPALDYNTAINHTHRDIVLNTKAPASFNNIDAWAALLTPLPGKIGATARAVLKGVTWLKCPAPASPVTNYIAYGSSIDYVLESKTEVLYSYTQGGDRLMLINMGNVPIQKEFFFQLTGNMTPFAGTRLTARATANFYNVTGGFLFTNFLYSWDGIIDDETTGFKGTAVLMNNTLIFDQANCEQS